MLTLPGRLCHGLGNPVVKQRAVRKTGQVIVQSTNKQRFLCLFPLGYVGMREQCTTRVMWHRLDGEFEPLLAVLPDDGVVHREAEASTGEHRENAGRGPGPAPPVRCVG